MAAGFSLAGGGKGGFSQDRVKSYGEYANADVQATNRADAARAAGVYWAVSELQQEGGKDGDEDRAEREER